MTACGRHCLRLFTLLALLFSAGAAFAGGLSVLPTRVDFTPGRGVQSVLIANTSAQTVTVETQVQVWPPDAAGRLASDLVVSPAVVTLAPDERVRVRIGLVRTRTGEAEAAYRLYFTELPAPAPTMGAGLGVRLRVGIPMFVAPTEPRPQPLRWTTRAAEDGFELVAHNEGNVHRRIGAVQLAGGEALALPGPYVLARSMLAVPLPRGPLTAGARVRWREGSDEHEADVAAPR